MSGGSMNYVCFQIEEHAYMLEDPEMIALAEDMAKIFHDAEWYHSSDIRREKYIESMKAFKKKWFEGDRTERLKSYIDEELNAVKRKCFEMIGGENDEGEQQASAGNQTVFLFG